jgi:hypothetical protein
VGEWYDSRKLQCAAIQFRERRKVGQPLGDVLNLRQYEKRPIVKEGYRTQTGLITVLPLLNFHKTGQSRDVLSACLNPYCQLYSQAREFSNLSSAPNIGPGRTMIASGKAARTASSPSALVR